MGKLHDAIKGLDKRVSRLEKMSWDLPPKVEKIKQYQSDNSIYAIARGHKTGIFYGWYGENGAEIQIKGFSKPLHQRCSSKDEAELFLKANQ